MGNLNISTVDIIVAVVMLGSAGFAFMRGFMHEVLSIAAWAGAGGAALYGFKPMQPFFRQHIASTLVADIATAAALFLVTLLVMSLVTKSVSDRVRRSALNSVDSSLGFLFGLLRGAFLLCLAYMAVMWVVAPEEAPSWLAEAKTRPWLDRGGRVLQSLAPEGFGMAENKARQASDDARQVIEAEQTFRKYVAPLPADPKAGTQGKPGEEAAPAKNRGYDRESRGQMERLFQTNQ